MKRLQIMIEEELDATLERRALAEGMSKAAIVRRVVGEALGEAASVAGARKDPLAEMAGVDDFDPASVDDVLYP